MVRVYRKPLAGCPAFLVAAHLDRQTHNLEVPPLVIRAQDCPIRSARVRVGSRGQVQLLGVRRIDRQAFHAQEVAVGHRQEIL